MSQLRELETFHRLFFGLPHSTMTRVNGASHHVLEHRHPRKRLDDLERASYPATRDHMRLLADKALPAEDDDAQPSAEGFASEGFASGVLLSELLTAGVARRASVP